MTVMTHDDHESTWDSMIKVKLMIWEEQNNRDCNVHTICMSPMNGASIKEC